MKKLVLLFLILSAVGCTSKSHKTDQEKANATVKIVTLSERSGGTGVILYSTNTESFILTNNHVCEAVKYGGFVVLDSETKYPVVSYKQSKIHDLCVVEVEADLKVSTMLAAKAPSLYDEAIVSGHPELLPTILTKGHFSGKFLGSVLVGRKECDSSITDPSEILMCMLMGGVPIIRNLEMQVVSATIQPGSSGSAVYDSNGNIAGLVFAGSGELGYGLVVPYEYIVNFLRNELPGLEIKFPGGSETDKQKASSDKIRSVCKLNVIPALKSICKLINRSTLYVE